MADSNKLTPSSTSATDKTHTYRRPSISSRDPLSAASSCDSPSASSSRSQIYGVDHEVNSTCRVYAEPWTYTPVDSQTSSSCASSRIFDEESHDSLAESYTISSNASSDRLSINDFGCSAASVLTSGSNTSSITLVEDLIAGMGNFSPSSGDHEVHAAPPTVTDDGCDGWSDDGTITGCQIEQCEADPAEIPGASVTDPTIQEAVSIDDKIYEEKVRRYAAHEQSRGSSGVEQTARQDSHTFSNNLKRLRQQHSLQRYLIEDAAEAPWTVFHLRSAGSICAFCGSTFTGLDHRQKVIDHTRDKHVTTASDLSSFTTPKRRTIKPRGRLPKGSNIATKTNSLASSVRDVSREDVPSWPHSHPRQHSVDFKGIGAMWMDELRLKHQMSAPPSIVAHVARTTDHTNIEGHLSSKQLLDKIHSRINSSLGRLNSEKLNDFFNGLDLLAEDLVHRFPRHDSVRGVQSALASLNQASDLQLDRWSSPTTCSAGPSDAPQDTGVGQSSSATPTRQSAREAESNKQSSRENKAPNPRGRRNDGGPKTTNAFRDKKRKLKTRYLACPFQKDDMVHGRHPTCKYEGADSMSTLKAHLAGQQHRVALPFIDMCSTCKEYVVSRSLWDSLHLKKQCISGSDKPRVQIRNTRTNTSRVGAQWLRLFEDLCPASLRLPSPYVHDPSWIVKTESRDPTHEHDMAHFRFPHFVADVLPPVAIQQYAASESTLDPTAPLPLVITAISRDTLLEPLLPNPQFQSFIINDQTANMSFLDDPSGAIGSPLRQPSEMQPTSHDSGFNAELSYEHAPTADGSSEGFGFYFDGHGALGGLASPPGLTPASSAYLGAQLAAHAALRSSVNDEDSARRASLLCILGHVERLIRPSDVEDDHAIERRITRVNAMTPEEVHALSDTLLSSVQQLPTIAPVQRARMPLPVATNHSNMPLTVAAESQPAAAQSSAPALSDQMRLDPFARLQWDDSDLFDYNSYGGLSRTFYPDDLLVAS